MLNKLAETVRDSEVSDVEEIVKSVTAVAFVAGPDSASYQNNECSDQLKSKIEHGSQYPGNLLSASKSGHADASVAGT